MKHGLLVGMISLAALIGWSGSVQGATRTEEMGYVGAQLGLGFINNGVGMQPTFGLTGGYNLLPDLLTVGAFVDYIGGGQIESATLALKDSGQTIIYYGLEGNYPLTFLIEGARVGLKLGLASSSISGATPGVFVDDVSKTQFFIGPKAEYYYPIAHGFSVGGEANVLFKTTNDEPAAGFDTVIGASVLGNILASLKYSF